ncbi:cytochrome c biogenesis protein CcsA [Paradesulfitobacterium aromaticivorans]
MTKLKNRLPEKLLSWLTFFSVWIALYLALVYAPTEKTMGDIQRIFYFHVASAWLGMFAFLVVFVASILYLITKEFKWDIFANTSAEIGVVFTTIVLITGPLWARPIWQTWWSWDPRLTTTLIMWFLYLAYGRIRKAIPDEEKRARYAAIYGILAFIDVPIVFFAIRWWRTMHPGALISSSGIGLAPDMKPAFFLSLISFTLLYFYLMSKSYRIERLSIELKTLRERIIGDR